MIEAQNISMRYGSFEAVKKCSFLVNQGEVVGLLGPNGAGKSTIMKILSAQIVPTCGTAKINGRDVIESPIQAKKELGYLPEQAPLYDEMEVREYLNFVARARHLSGQELEKRLSWIAETCGLGRVWCRPIGQLSKGYKQRVGLAQALIHDPPVLVLDEPTSGLDPLQIIEIRELVKELAKTKAVLFSTHILQEIEAVSDRILIINEGQIVADGKFNELAAQVYPKEIVQLAIAADADPEAVLKGLPGVESVEALSRENGIKKFILTGPKDSGLDKAIAQAALDHGWKVVELAKKDPDLEEIFTALIRRQFKNKN